MDNITLIVIGGSVAAIAVAFISGYICGSYSERVEWNRLIQEGRLPRPVQEPVRFRNV